MSVGGAVGAISSAVLQDTWQDWRVLILLGMVPPSLALAGLFVTRVPESPRWLVAQGRSDDAQEALEHLEGDRPTAKRVLQDIQAELQSLEEGSWSALLFPRAAHRPRVV